MTRKLSQVAVAVVLGAAVGWGLSRITPVPTPDLTTVQQMRLKRAFWDVQARVGNLANSGASPLGLTSAVTELAKAFNATQRIDPEEAQALRKVGVEPRPIPVVVGQPTGLWQIVLVPDPLYDVVHVLAYGDTLSTPSMAEDVTPAK